MTVVAEASAAHIRGFIARMILGTEATEECLGSIHLRASQRDSADRLLHLLDAHGGAVLADPVGSGKTYTALAVAARLGKTATIIGPSSLRTMWAEAVGAAAIDARYVTHESLSRGGTIASSTDLLIVDEAHRFRTATTRRYAALAAACGARRVLLLSATPIQNRRTDLESLVALFLGRRARDIPDEELATFVVRAEETRAAPSGLPRQRGPIAVQLADDDDCLDHITALPPPISSPGESVASALVVYGLAHQWASSRAALVEALRRRRSRGMAMLAALDAGHLPTRAELSAWSHGDDALQLAFPEIVSKPATEETSLETLSLGIDRHLAGIQALLHHCKTSPNPDLARAEALLRIRAGHPGERIIAFCHYAETVKCLKQRLANVPGIATLTARGAEIASGRVPRETIITQFAPAASGQTLTHGKIDRVDLLITTDLLSEGLNLQEASVVVHLDLPWNPARLEQRVGRVRRFGSRHPSITVYTFAPPASAERMLQIEQRLRDKLRVAEKTVGIAGHILPSLLAPASQPLTELHTSIRRALLDWSSTGIVGLQATGLHAATVAGRSTGFLALVRRSGSYALVAEVDGVMSEASDQLARAIDAAQGTEISTCGNARDDALERLRRFLETQRATLAVDFKAAASARARRSALRRVAQAIARTPRHRRHVVAPLADAARAVASATFGEGAERVLEMLVAAELPDEAWLRSVAAFGELNARPAKAPSPLVGDAEIVALLIFREAAL